MRIYAIDPSLKSTGHCVVDVVFDKNDSDLLLKLLVSSEIKLTSKEIEEFRRIFKVILMTQTESPKVLEKSLAKVRKDMRDEEKSGEVSLENLNTEMKLLQERNNIQVDEIKRFHNQLCPSLTIMEDYSYHSAGSLTQLAEMKGLLLGTAAFPIHTAVITSVKKIGSTKGNANKDIMYKYIQRFPVNVEIVEGNDDEIDALAICLSVFYSMYFRIFGFNFPEAFTSKDKKEIKQWIKTLTDFSNRIGNRCDMENMLNERTF